jgi:hypothetical protein
MSDSSSSAPDVTRLRPEDLPPVEPPSSGYIVQLFLIPALIVAAVVAVWALFGKLADSGADWQQMVVDLGSGNEHRRGRAAHGLSQLLRNEEIAPPTDTVPLADQPEVIDALTSLLDESLDSVSQAPSDLQHQSFLARTVGSLNDSSKTLPVLARALDSGVNTDVRQSALMAVAIIAGRKLEKRTGYDGGSAEAPATDDAVTTPVTEPTIDNAEVWDALRKAAQDQEPVIRHLAAFAIGNVGGSEALKELRVLLLDGDPRTRANAAFGLVRNGSPDGLPAVIDLMSDALKPWDEASLATLDEAQRAREVAFHNIEQPQIVRNCLRAIQNEWSALDAAQQERVVDVVSQLADSYHTPDVRSQAGNLLKTIQPGK